MSRSSFGLRACFVVALAILASAGLSPAAAQETTGQPASDQPPSAQEQPAASPEVTAARQAVQELAAGRAAKAVEILEPLQEAGASAQIVALLGTAYLEAGQADKALATLKPLADEQNANPAVLYNAARAALATGANDAAQTYLQRSVALQSDTPAARTLGLIRGRQGRMRDAYRLLRPWANDHPDDTEARMAAALAAIQLERVSDAERYLDGLPMESARVRLLWAQLRLLQEDARGALAMLDPVLDEHPAEADLDIRRTAADAHLALDEPEAAVELLQGHADSDPRAALELGRAQDTTGATDAALATMEPFAKRLLQLAAQKEGQVENTDLASSFASEYGQLLSKVGRHEEALPYLSIATHLSEDDAGAWKALEQSLTALGQTDQAATAKENLEKATEMEAQAAAHAEQRAVNLKDPTGREMRRAQNFLQQGKGEQALTVIRAEKELAPDDVRVWVMESRTLLLLKRSGEALDVAEQAVRHFPGSVDAYYQRGASELAIEHYDKAEADLRKALELEPDHVPSLNDLAVLLIIQGKKDEARTMLQKVLELHPDDPRATETLEHLDSGQ